MLTIAIEETKTKNRLIDINESKEKVFVNGSNQYPDLLSKPKVVEFARQNFGDWLVFRQPGQNRFVIGEPGIDKNKNVGYSDYATLDEASSPQLFMICDKEGKGLKLKDVRTDMTVKIMAQKSHFFNFKYLSADGDVRGRDALVWYDLLRPDGEDKKQEWIVIKKDHDIEPIFYFKSAHRVNDFMTAEVEAGLTLYLDRKENGRWDVQIFE